MVPKSQTRTMHSQQDFLTVPQLGPEVGLIYFRLRVWEPRVGWDIHLGQSLLPACVEVGWRGKLYFFAGLTQVVIAIPHISPTPSRT